MNLDLNERRPRGRSGSRSAAALLGLLLAACNVAPPDLLEVQAPGDTRDAGGPYRVLVVTRGAVDHVDVRWSDQAGDLDRRVRLGSDGEGRWSGDLPGQPAGSRVRLQVRAIGGGGKATWPPGGEHVFRVLATDGACLVDGDCLGGEVCDRARHVCRVPPDACAGDADCPQDYACRRDDGVCVFRPLPCSRDAECGNGRVCKDGACADAAECVDDADCPAGAQCLAPPGRCAARDVCTRDADCPGGRCESGRCRDDLPGCDPACGPGETCRDGKCVSACDPACAPGQTCQQGQCVAESGCAAGCPPGLHCDGDECVECTADTDCTGGLICDRTTSTCFESPACMNDLLEPNDTPDEATIVGAGADIRGMACPGDEDVFRIRLHDGQRGLLTMEPSGSGLRYALVGSNGAPQAQGDLDVPLSVPLPPDPQGSLLTLACPGCLAGYHLTVQAGDTEMCADDGLEPDDSFDSAVPVDVPADLPGLVLCAGDEDFVRFRYVGDGLAVRIEFRNADGDLDLDLLDADGRRIAHSTGHADSEEVQLAGSRPGLYAVRIYGFAFRPGQSTTYRLTIR